MKSKNLYNSVQSNLIKLVSSIGIRTSAWIAILLVLSLLINFKLGSIQSPVKQGLIADSNDQKLLSVQFLATIDDIDQSLKAQNWDSLTPALSLYKEQYNQWINTHEKLSTNRINKQINNESGLSAADYYDRISYTKTQITHAVNELQIVTDSIARRAPYISQNSQSRVLASTRSIRELFPAYIESLTQIGLLYESHAEQSKSNSIASIKRISLLLFLAIFLLPYIAIAPRIAALNADYAQLENELSLSQAAVSQRWNMLTSLGQELRSPLNNINDLANQLSSEHHDKESLIEHAQSIINESTNLSELLEDIFLISAIEAGTFQTQPRAFDLQALLESIETQIQPSTTEKGLAFSIQLDDSCPTEVTTDEQYLERLLMKLIENAIQFTNAGSISIHASLEQLDEHSQLSIRIMDTGIGIKHEHIPRIFDPFRRVESTDQHDHHGLGLTVAQSLARELGGDITIESALGAGCFVTVTISLDNAASTDSTDSDTIQYTQSTEIESDGSGSNPQIAANKNTKQLQKDTQSMSKDAA